MKNGTIEAGTFNDRTTGVAVRQLTDYFAHNYHLYFTNPGWWDGGKRLVFGSERGNASNLWSIEIESGVISPITENGPGDSRQGWQNGFVDASTDQFYSWRGRELWGIDLKTRKHRVLATAPEGFNGANEACTADGKYVVCALMEPPDVGPVNLGQGYIGFGAIWAARPRSQIVRIPTEGSGHTPEVLFEENYWVGHVNPSPTDPNILTYCHEGPWTKVDQRMWGMEISSGRTWKLRPQSPPEQMGHEYWLEDGKTVGYQGKWADGRSFFGFIRHDGAERQEVLFEYDSHHVHSNTRELIVGDGPAKERSPYVVLMKFDGQRMHGPRVLCTHRGSRHTQHLHVHPRFTPDGKSILYTADPSGYGNLYLVEIPEFESLPLLSDVVKKK